MRQVYLILAGLCCTGILAVVAALPVRQPNLDYVRSATAFKLMQELNDPRIAFRVKAAPAAARDESLVSGRGEERVESEIQGLRIATRTTYTFSGITKSHCMEIEPGCLEIDHGPFSKLISVEVPM
jgi:hypothetical protein